MIHMKNGRPLLSDLSALVWLHAAVLLLLMHFFGSQSQSADQPQPVVAMVGDDIILPCHLDPAVDAVSMTVEWARSDLKPRFVHVRRDGVELLIDQNPSYVGRTSVSSSKLKCGDLSLSLSRVKLSDEGTYTCIAATQGRQSVVRLAVASVSPPVLKISRLSGEDSGVLLQCESRGWYPEPELLWLDAEGNLLPAGPTETVPGPDGLYTVSGRATVEQRHGSSFTCRVQQSNTNQSRETHIQVADDLFTVTPSPVGRVLIVLAVCITCVLTFILAAFITGRQKTKNKLHHADETGQKEHETNTPDIQTERQAPMGSERETSQLLVHRETESHVTWEKEKLDEELKRNEEELGDVLLIIKMLNEQKDDVKNHREKVFETLQEMIEKTMKDKNEDKETKKQRRRAARDEILQKSDKLMKTTDEMILKMTEMKVRLEKDTEQVNKQLKKRDENQRKLLSEQSEREG